MPEELGPQDARQASRGRHVLIILVAAMVLAFIAWAIADVYFFQVAPDQQNFPAEEGQTTQSEAPESPTQHLDNPDEATPDQDQAEQNKESQ